jgi:hypothetical protein
MWTLKDALDRDERLLAEDRRNLTVMENDPHQRDTTAEYIPRLRQRIIEMEQLLKHYGRAV